VASQSEKRRRVKVTVESVSAKRWVAPASALVAILATALAFTGKAEAVEPRIVSLTSANRHASMTFSAPRAAYVTVTFARNPARSTDGSFLDENVVHSDFLTDAEAQSGRWVDERQLDPGVYFVMLRVLAESSCTSFPPPDYGEVVDPSCADGSSPVVMLTVPKPKARFSVKVEQLRFIGIIYLSLKVRPLGATLPYRVCWRTRSRRRACVRASVGGYDWNSDAEDRVSVRSRLLANRTTFTWFVGTRAVARRTIRVLRS
jgi:hypothetical protein